MFSNMSRRRLLASTAVSAAAPSLLVSGTSFAADPPPETTTIRLRHSAAICFAPLYLAEAFLHAEGFDTIEYVDGKTYKLASVEMVSRGNVDIDVAFAGFIARHLDLGRNLTAIGGLHAGCYELFAHEPIRTFADLKGKRVGVRSMLSSSHLYVSIMARHIGLDPMRDIEWIAPTDGTAMDQFIAGETDAYLGFPPEPQEIRDSGSYRVILNTYEDKPWSQYFCCMIYGNRDWIRDHPVATKRFLRAIYKAADFCTAAPEAAARQVVDSGKSENYDHTLETIQAIPYDLWNEFDSEDTLRFYALRLHDAGMLDHSPNDLLSEGTDWRFANELRGELKA